MRVELLTYRVNGEGAMQRPGDTVDLPAGEAAVLIKRGDARALASTTTDKHTKAAKGRRE